MTIHLSNMVNSKSIMVVLVVCSITISFSSCMKREVVGDYAAKIYHYPQPQQTSFENIERRVVTDSSGVSRLIVDTLTLHVEPERMETSIRFFLHIDKELNVSASYHRSPLEPPTDYYGKGRIRKDSLYVDFYYRETKEPGLGGTVFDSVKYSTPLTLRFATERPLDRLELSYFPIEQKVDSLDEYWSSYYSFKIQEEY